MTSITVEEVAAREVRKWGHAVDELDRAAIALVLADEELRRVAGVSEDIENAAYRVQCSAFNQWDAAIRRTVEACQHRDMDYSWIADTSYGGAVSAVRGFKFEQAYRSLEAVSA